MYAIQWEKFTKKGKWIYSKWQNCNNECLDDYIEPTLLDGIFLKEGASKSLVECLAIVGSYNNQM